jgi:hypothetical protein
MPLGRAHWKVSPLAQLLSVYSGGQDPSDLEFSLTISLNYEPCRRSNALCDKIRKP